MNKKQTPFWPVICAIFFGNFLAILSTTSIAIAFPVVMNEFHTNLSTVQWLMAGYLLATGVVAPIVGYLGDQLSYKRLFILSLAGFTLFSFLCAMAWDIQSLVIFRVIQGVFGGMIIPITLTIIYQVIEPARQAQAMGLWSLASMLAPVVGPTFGGWLVEIFSWEAIFLINIPVGLLAVFLVWKFIPYYSLSTKKTFDLLGFLSVITSSSFLLLAFSQGSSWGWTSWKTTTLLVAGCFLLAFFIRWELRSEAPLLQLKVFKFSRFKHSLIINWVVTISMYTGTLLVPLYLQTVLELSPMDAGLIMLPGAIVMAAASPVIGKFYDKIGPFRLIMTGILLITVSTWAFSFIGVETSALYIGFLQLIRCFGIALCNMPLLNAGMSAVTKEYTGHASAITNWTRQGLASLSIGIFSSVVVIRTSHYMETGTNNPSATAMGIDDVFLLGTFISLAAIPLAFLLRKNETKTVEITHLTTLKK